jgi:hypothetical protein
MEFNWDTNGRKCTLLLDGKPAGMIEDNHRSSGLNYLRLRSTAEQTDGGLVIRGVSADVSESWRQ